MVLLPPPNDMNPQNLQSQLNPSSSPQTFKIETHGTAKMPAKHDKQTHRQLYQLGLAPFTYKPHRADTSTIARDGPALRCKVFRLVS